MDNKEQREFLASLKRPQINQLCLEMQAIISNVKLFLADTHGYSDEEISKIIRGYKYDDLESPPKPSRPIRAKQEPKAQREPTKPKSPAKSNDLAREKREDEMIRRSMSFELEWCLSQVKHGNKPYTD